MSIYSNFSVFLIFLSIIQNVCKYSTAEEGDGHVFLITGGYRPQSHTLAKHIVSIRTRYERRYFGDNHFCGGSILSARVILTAAHCVRFGSRTLSSYDVRVVAKTPNRLVETYKTQLVDVKTVIPHPQYNSQTHQNDIALLLLYDDVNEDGVFAQRIAVTDAEPKGGTNCTALGWGRMYFHGPLAADCMYVDIDIVDTKECQEKLDSAADTHIRSDIVRRGMICAGDDTDKEKDSCSGDSGGPLICNGKVAGVVSFGIECSKGWPGFYADVWHYRQWIQENRGTRNLSAHYALLSIFTIFVYYIV